MLIERLLEQWLLNRLLRLVLFFMWLLWFFVVVLCVMEMGRVDGVGV